jgi:SET domain-containing protein
MLMIKASAKPSGVEGLGLFADEKIPKGTVMWKYDPRFDISFTEDEVARMNPMQQALVHTYSYRSARLNAYIYSIDDTRFTNHSSVNANEEVVLFPGDVETSGVAKRDIEAGEEILIDYRTFDIEDAVSNEEYLRS